MSHNITNFPTDEISYAEAYTTHLKEKSARGMKDTLRDRSKDKATQPRPAAGRPGSAHPPRSHGAHEKPVGTIDTRPKSDLNKPLPPSPPNRSSRERPNLGVNTNAAAAASAAAKKHAQPAFMDPFTRTPLSRQSSMSSEKVPGSPLKRIGSWISTISSRRGSNASQDSIRSLKVDKFTNELKKELGQVADGARWLKNDLKQEFSEYKDGAVIAGQKLAHGTKKVVDKIETAVEGRKTKQKEKEAERKICIAQEVENEIAEARRQADDAREGNAYQANDETAQREAKRIERERRRQEATARSKKPSDFRATAGKLADKIAGQFPSAREGSPDFFSDAAPPGMMEPCNVCGKIPQGVLNHGRCNNCGSKIPAKSLPKHPLPSAPTFSSRAFSSVSTIALSPPRKPVNERLGNVNTGKPALVSVDDRNSFVADVAGPHRPPSPLIPITGPPRFPHTMASSAYPRAPDNDKPSRSEGDRVLPPLPPPIMRSNLDELIEAERRRRRDLRNPTASSVYSRAPDDEKPFLRPNERMPSNPAASSVYSRAPEDDKRFLRPGEIMPPIPPMPEEVQMLPNPAASSVYSRLPEDDKPYGRYWPKTTQVEKDIREEILAAIDETREAYNITGTTISNPRPVPSELPARESSPISPVIPKPNFF